MKAAFMASLQFLRTKAPSSEFTWASNTSTKTLTALLNITSPYILAVNHVVRHHYDLPVWQIYELQAWIAHTHTHTHKQRSVWLCVGYYGGNIRDCVPVKKNDHRAGLSSSRRQKKKKTRSCGFTAFGVHIRITTLRIPLDYIVASFWNTIWRNVAWISSRNSQNSFESDLLAEPRRLEDIYKWEDFAGRKKMKKCCQLLMCFLKLRSRSNKCRCAFSIQKGGLIIQYRKL